MENKIKAPKSLIKFMSKQLSLIIKYNELKSQAANYVTFMKLEQSILEIEEYFFQSHLDSKFPYTEILEAVKADPEFYDKIGKLMDSCSSIRGWNIENLNRKSEHGKSIPI